MSQSTALQRVSHLQAAHFEPSDGQSPITCAANLHDADDWHGPGHDHGRKNLTHAPFNTVSQLI
jgi:hypothetical protein